MSEDKDSMNEPSSRNSILQQSKLNITLKTSMLRPSLFSNTGLNETTHETKDDTDSELLTSMNSFVNEEKQELPDSSQCEEKEISKEEKKEDPMKLLTQNGFPKSNFFSAPTAVPLAESSGFIFGQNVHERVITENIQKTNTSVNKEKSSENENIPIPSNSKTDLLFSNVVQSQKNDEEKASKETNSKSLTEVAREYEESRAQKRKYEEVETFTGEENEINIIDLNCKIFAFVNGNYEERGRGTLRLNDSKEDANSSRVVFRTAGNLRLLLNTKIWSGMIAERPSEKSLRLTAMDNTGQIKIFLIMSRPDDISRLFDSLEERIQLHKSLKENTQNGSKSSNEIKDLSPPSPKKSTITQQDE